MYQIKLNTIQLFRTRTELEWYLSPTKKWTLAAAAAAKQIKNKIYYINSWWPRKLYRTADRQVRFVLHVLKSLCKHNAISFGPRLLIVFWILLLFGAL
jgi:hypothetical protein